MNLAKRFRSSLRAKFIGAIGGVVLVTAAGFFMVGFMSLRRTVVRLGVRNSQALVERYAVSVANLLAMHNELELDDLSSVVGREEGVVEAYVLDPNGMFMTHSDFRRLGGQRPVYEVVRPSEGRRRPYEVVRRPDGRRVWLFSASVPPFTAHVEVAPEVVVRRPLTVFLLRFSLIFGVILLVALMIAVRTAGALVRPIRELTRGVEVVASGDFDHRIPRRSEDELGVLTEAFNRMTAGLKEAQELRAHQERMRAELEFAAEIQMKMIPSLPLVLPGYRVDHRYLPAKEVGGDHYDLFPSEGRLGFVLCDVSGKGVPAAMVTGMLKTIFLTLAGREVGPAETLRTANRLLRRNIRHRVFATALYGELDLRSHTLVFATAGSGRLFLVEPGRAVRDLRTPGLPLGLMDDAVFREEIAEERVVVPPGGMVFAATDGVTETRSPDGRFFGEEGIREALETCGDPAGFADRLVELLEAFRGPSRQEDDVSLILISRTEEGTA